MPSSWDGGRCSGSQCFDISSSLMSTGFMICSSLFSFRARFFDTHLVLALMIWQSEKFYVSFVPRRCSFFAPSYYSHACDSSDLPMTLTADAKSRLPVFFLFHLFFLAPAGLFRVLLNAIGGPVTSLSAVCGTGEGIALLGSRPTMRMQTTQ